MVALLNPLVGHQRFDMDFKLRRIIMTMNCTVVDLRANNVTVESVENAAMHGVNLILFIAL